VKGKTTKPVEQLAYWRLVKLLRRARGSFRSTLELEYRRRHAGHERDYPEAWDEWIRAWELRTGNLRRTRRAGQPWRDVPPLPKPHTWLTTVSTEALAYLVAQPWLVERGRDLAVEVAEEYDVRVSGADGFLGC
jgi:hypothetical protein